MKCDICNHEGWTVGVDTDGVTRCYYCRVRVDSEISPIQPDDDFSIADEFEMTVRNRLSQFFAGFRP